MRVNHTVLKRCNWCPWPDLENDVFFSQLSALKTTSIYNQRDVRDAIKALELLEFKLSIWMNEYETFEIEAIDHIFGIYRKHLDLLKAHEGVRFNSARVSFRRSLRVIQFVLQSICDDY